MWGGTPGTNPRQQLLGGMVEVEAAARWSLHGRKELGCWVEDQNLLQPFVFSKSFFQNPLNIIIEGGKFKTTTDSLMPNPSRLKPSSACPRVQPPSSSRRIALLSGRLPAITLASLPLSLSGTSLDHPLLLFQQQRGLRVLKVMISLISWVPKGVTKNVLVIVEAPTVMVCDNDLE
jgi:hypothetical protein